MLKVFNMRILTNKFVCSLFFFAVTSTDYPMEASFHTKEASPEKYFHVPVFEEGFSFNKSLENIKALGDHALQDMAEKNLKCLHILANLLIVTNIAFNEIKSAMKQYDSGALATNQAASIKGFYFVDESNIEHKKLQEKGLNIQQINLDDVCDNRCNVPIASTKGKAALFQFLPLTNSDSFAKSMQNRQAILDESMNDTNEEVIIIATHVKNQLCQKCRSINLIGTSLWLLYPLLCLEKKPNHYEWQTRDSFKDIKISCELLEAKDYHALLCDWLKNENALSTVQNTMAHTLWVYKFLNALTKYIRVEPVNYNITLENDTQLHFSQVVNSSLERLDPYFQKSSKLYEMVMNARTAILMKHKNKRNEYVQKTANLFLHLIDGKKFHRLPPKLSSYGNYKETDVTLQPKNEKKQKPRPSKKKHHKRHNKKKPSEKPNVSTERKPRKKIIKKIPQQRSIEYDPRVVSWLNKTNAHEEIYHTSIPISPYFYHTFSPYADEIMIRYGNKSIKPNKKNPALMDTCYYMAGEIHDKYGNRKTVVFHCVIGPDGLCYHRGIDEAEDIMNILLSSYDYNFPQLGDDENNRNRLDLKICKIAESTEDFYGISEYKQDSFCFYLKDSRNSIKQIVLFKPSLSYAA
jgi:hypothetical protein